MSEDHRKAGGRPKPDSAQTRKIQEEALIGILMSIRDDSGNGGSSQLPGGLQRRATSSWEVFNNSWRKKG